MNTPLSVYDTGLRSGRVHMLRTNGSRRALPMSRWIADHDQADTSLLSRCTGTTMDIGCGPGRLAAALTSRGVPTLGIDLSRVAVAMTRQRGAIALRRDVFDQLPGEGRWDHLLLADGNIGIGGDPARLLRRCRALLAPTGTVILDLEPPGSGLLVEQVRLEQSGTVSAPFRWCWLGVDALATFATAADLHIRSVWLAGDRWQAELEIQANGDLI